MKPNQEQICLRTRGSDSGRDSEDFLWQIHQDCQAAGHAATPSSANGNALKDSHASASDHKSGVLVHHFMAAEQRAGEDGVQVGQQTPASTQKYVDSAPKPSELPPVLFIFYSFFSEGDSLPCARTARALHAHCALLLDYVPPEEPPSTPLGNALRIR